MPLLSRFNTSLLACSALLLTACGGGSSSSTPTPVAPTAPNSDQPTNQTPEVPTATPSVITPDTPVDVTAPIQAPTDPVAEPAPEPTPEPTPEPPVISDEPTDETPVTVNAASATGADLSGSQDDSPTLTETLSLVGPFIKNASRGAGPPSIPEGLTLLLSGENWVEFSWAPSTDDQSVEAYEIYRDGVLQYTVRGDTNNEFDYRSWLSTSYIDCNYTRYANCLNSQPAVGSTHEYTIVAVDNEGMSSAPSAPVVMQFQSPQDSSVDLSDFVPVFDEQFNGDTLDRSLWKTSLPWGENTTINLERQYFVNTFGNNPTDYDPFVFTGSTLQITGVPTPAEDLSAVNNLPYLSGVLTTADHFEMTYGYVEMRAKVASGQGLLSTFYLFNQDFEKNQPEIDILEYLGDRPDKTYQTYHYYDSNRARYFSGEKHSSPTMESTTGIDMSADFHTYGLLWEEGLAVWYIDGREVKRLAGVRISDEPMNIIAHLVIGSEWIGEPDASAIPAVLEIDHIRAWQRR